MVALPLRAGGRALLLGHKITLEKHCDPGWATWLPHTFEFLSHAKKTKQKTLIWNKVAFFSRQVALNPSSAILRTNPVLPFVAWNKVPENLEWEGKKKTSNMSPQSSPSLPYRHWDQARKQSFFLLRPLIGNLAETTRHRAGESHGRSRCRWKFLECDNGRPPGLATTLIHHPLRRRKEEGARNWGSNIWTSHDGGGRHLMMYIHNKNQPKKKKSYKQQQQQQQHKLMLNFNPSLIIPSRRSCGIKHSSGPSS